MSIVKNGLSYVFGLASIALLMSGGIAFADPSLHNYMQDSFNNHARVAPGKAGLVYAASVMNPVLAIGVGAALLIASRSLAKN